MGEAKRKRERDHITFDLVPMIHPDWAKWLFLAAFYDQVSTAHWKAGHVLMREEFMKSGAIVMLPNECIAMIAMLGMPFRFVNERMPDVLAEKRAAARRTLGGIELTDRG